MVGTKARRILINPLQGPRVFGRHMLFDFGRIVQTGGIQRERRQKDTAGRLQAEADVVTVYRLHLGYSRGLGNKSAGAFLCL